MSLSLKNFNPKRSSISSNSSISNNNSSVSLNGDFIDSVQVSVQYTITLKQCELLQESWDLLSGELKDTGGFSQYI
eukprot:Pgem_evm1s11217